LIIVVNRRTSSSVVEADAGGFFLERAVFLFSFLLISARVALGFSTDADLLQLVPPQSRLVAGMSSAAGQGTMGSFLVVTRENKTDLKDFLALTGGDASRRLHGLVFVTGVNDGTGENGHSLLVSGRFDRESIFRFAGLGATRQTYRGIPVLVVPPFEREREAFDETRWLAIPEGQIAIFGSMPSVQREIDRWLGHSAPDKVVLAEFHRLDGHQDTWCLLLAKDRQGIAENALGKLDSKLGTVAHNAGLLGYGIKFGRKVAIVVAADPYSSIGSSAEDDVEGMENRAAMQMFSLLPGGGTSSRAIVKVSRRRYEEWIGESAARDPLISGVAPQ
jgi:hypothetical protein